VVERAEAMSGRYVVVLKNAHGVPVSTCDFEDQKAAEKYFEQAQIAAEQMGGKAEMDPEPTEESGR
jgi:hypothetical protein